MQELPAQSCRGVREFCEDPLLCEVPTPYFWLIYFCLGLPAMIREPEDTWSTEKAMAGPDSAGGFQGNAGQ